MKKILITGLIGLFPFLLIAQQVAMTNKDANKTRFATTGTLTSADGSKNTAKSAKALRKEARETRHFDNITKAFNQNFKDVSDVQWTSGKNLFVASFTKEGTQNKIWYTKGGGILYSMLTYGPDKLPAREQQVIHDEYADYKMTSVDEVHQNNITVYVVHLENDHNIKLITVCDGETNVYSSYKKM